jgi:GT2 family glycosyltransferase/glycosyltransferase involved in cell wall biosynthesis
MRILMVVHGFPPSGMGGTEVYTHDLAHALKRGFGDEVFVFTREADPAQPEYKVREEDTDGITVTRVNNTFKACRSFEETYRNPSIRRIGADLIDAIEPDVAHVQHLTCLSTELVLELARRRIPTLFTLHDYWLICHRGQLLDLDYRRCEGPYPAGCRRCIGMEGSAGPAAYRAASALRSLESRFPFFPAALVLRAAARWAGSSDRSPSTVESETRLRHMQEMSRAVTHFLAPSSTLRERFLKFGIEPDRITYREQGIDQRGFANLERTPRRELRIGFLGSLMVSKAPHLLLEAFAGLPRGAASLHVFGWHASYHGDDSYRKQLEPLLKQPGVSWPGPVPHERVPETLASLDVIVVPSVWLENAPFIIREAFAAGVPVVASNLGGMAELVAHESNGLLFEPGSAADLQRTLRRLLAEPGLLDRLRAGIPRMRAIEEDAAWTREQYLACAARASRLRQPSSGDAADRSARIAGIVLNYRTPEDTWLAVRSLQASRRPIADVIAVDNGSDDGSVDRLKSALPDVRLLAAPRNLGFAGGCNLGIRDALDRGADLILLVNSDVLLPPDALERMEDVLLGNPDVGIVAPVLLSRSMPELVLSAGITFSSVTGRMWNRGSGTAYTSLSRAPMTRVDGASACVMLVRRVVFDRIGLLDEKYFFSFEDLDFCLRARRAGFLTAIASDAVVYHEGSRSIGPRSPRRVYFATRNHLLLAKQATPLPVPGIGLLRAGSILALNAAFVLSTGEVPRLEGLRGVARGAWHHIIRRYGDGP